MNDDDIDFLAREHLVLRSDTGHGSSEDKIVIADDSGHILGDLDALAELRDKLAGKFDGREVISAMHKGTKDIVDSMVGVGVGIGDLGVRASASREAMDSTFHIPRERKVLIQSQQRVSRSELFHIPEDRREEFLDHVKERALQGMIEQADLVNAVSYEEGIDPMTHEKIIIAKLKVIIDD